MVVGTAVVVLVVVPGDIGFASAMAYGVGSALGAVLIMLLLSLLYRLTVGGDHQRGPGQEGRRYRDADGVSPHDDETQSRKAARQSRKR